MSYEKHTWVNNETITAAKMNNIEDGIEEAAQSGGGNCVATVRLGAQDFNSSSKAFGSIVYAIRTNNTWVVCNDSDGDIYNWLNINGFAMPVNRAITVLLPSDENVGVFLVDYLNDSRTITGDISTTAETLYYSYGSIVSHGSDAYRITGNGSYTFIGL